MREKKKERGAVREKKRRSGVLKKKERGAVREKKKRSGVL